MLRVYQTMGLAFIFIPSNVLSYVGIPREKNNQISSMINFVRNIGGSILIAITNAQVTSRAMWHQQHLQQNMVPGSFEYQQHLNALNGFLGGHFGSPNGGGMALATLYNQLNQQAQMQGYQDVYMELCYMSILLIFLAFMLSKNRPGQGAGAGAMH
jgi:DHA2 family multidrug resistance protein